MFCQVVVFRGAPWYNTRSMQHMNASKTVRLPSLVETISLGFGVVNRCLWVLLIPVFLDLVYWLGPRLSIQPLIEQLVAISQAMGPQRADPNVLQVWDQLGAQAIPFDLAQLGLPRQTNIFAPKYINLLTPWLRLPQAPFAPPVWRVDNLALLVLVQVLAVFCSLLATSIYLFALANTVRGTRARSALRRWSRGFASVLGIGLLFTVLVLLLSVPLSLLLTFTLVLSPVVAELVLVVVLALLVWLLFTASFAFDAVFMSDYGPVRALMMSLHIVQRSFWAAAGLFVLSWLILDGLSFVWQMVATTSLGLAIAIVGSAYISSGLAAAHLIFYRDRLSRIGRQP